MESGRPDLGRRYDWSNPEGLSTPALCLKVLRASRYDDMLRLARHTGTDVLERVAMGHPELRDNRFLMRKLSNLRAGLEAGGQSRDHAPEA